MADIIVYFGLMCLAGVLITGILLVVDVLMTD